jgi:hypothetical protein
MELLLGFFIFSVIFLKISQNLLLNRFFFSLPPHHLIMKISPPPCSTAKAT